MILRAIVACAVLLSVQCGSVEKAPEPQAVDGAVWAVDPEEPGLDELPAGHSLFDELFSKAVDGERVYDVPFPFEDLTARIAAIVSTERDENLRQVLIPIGRSLQRSSNRPNYFASPRVVVAVDGEAPPTGEPRPYLKDRLFLGYQAKVGIIEVISYNEQAGRFEFQIVGDYQPGREPEVRYAADRSECIACHQGLAPIFPRPLWNETSANEDVRALLATHASEFFGVPVEQGVDIPQLIDQATDRANLFASHQLVWSQACPDAQCRADALFAVLAYRLGGHRHTDGPEMDRFTTALAHAWTENWPDGLKIPNPDIPDRDIIGNLKETGSTAPGSRGRSRSPGPPASNGFSLTLVLSSVSRSISSASPIN